MPPRILRFFQIIMLCLGIGSLPMTATMARASEDDDMDKLLAPIALYPDALLAQVLTAATCPDQVKEFQEWLGKQTVTGSDLQQAAMDAKFDAAFASLAVFPDVVKLLAENADWTKEIGTAYLSSKDKVSASIQRLRAKAQTAGNLKSNDQQKVTVSNEGGSQTVIIEPANPQVVYVPQYDPTVVYVQAAPTSPSSDAAVAAVIGFGLGIAIGAAISNDYYGWGAWGWGWHGGGVYYHRSAWVVPMRPRYPYVRPVPVYRPSRTVVAPRRTNVNINVDNSRTNVGNHVNVGNSNNVNRGNNNIDRGNSNNRDNGGGNRNRDSGSSTARGRASAGNAGGSDQSAFGGYGSRSSTNASSDRGRASVGSSRSGGGGASRGGGGGGASRGGGGGARGGGGHGGGGGRRR